MNKTLIVARHEFGIMLRRKVFLVLTALFPLLGLIGAGVFLLVHQDDDGGPADQRAVLGYVDWSGRLNDFREWGQTAFQRFPNEVEGVQALVRGDIDSLYLIGADYPANPKILEVKKQRPGIGGPSGLGQAEVADSGPIRAFLLANTLMGTLTPEELQRVRVPLQLSTVLLNDEGALAEGRFNAGRFIFFGALAVLVLIAIFAASGYMLQGVSEEKENRIMEVLLSSVTPAQLMIGKLLAQGAAGLIQVMVWTAAAIGIFALVKAYGPDLPSLSVPAAGSGILAAVYFLLGYTLYAALMGAVGAVTSTNREAQQLSVIFVLPGAIPFCVLTPILANPDGLLARTLSVIPLTAPTTALIRMAMDAMSPLDLAVSLLTLTAATALALALSLRLFRTYLLMFGQRPSLWRIAATVVRGA